MSQISQWGMALMIAVVVMGVWIIFSLERAMERAVERISAKIERVSAKRPSQ